ncbi:hypothetical protein SEA_BRATAYLOR_24 [Streptomyces phage Brataylor]|uniref:Uncharacterized protein n=1 Tax=Streptomyces phage Brataylor TaxID=1873994 RepID=A0A1C9LWX3_9CAUD|nr:hypothetical protein SEA_BRATAYLOR_24 [Streptomyces phage Brataylor]
MASAIATIPVTLTGYAESVETDELRKRVSTMEASRFVEFIPAASEVNTGGGTGEGFIVFSLKNKMPSKVHVKGEVWAVESTTNDYPNQWNGVLEIVTLNPNETREIRIPAGNEWNPLTEGWVSYIQDLVASVTPLA